MSDALVRTWSSVMADVLPKSLILALLLAGAAWGMRRSSAARRHLVYVLFPVGLLALPLLACLLPQWQIQVGRAETVAAPALSAPPPVLSPQPALRTPALPEPMAAFVPPPFVPAPAVSTPSPFAPAEPKVAFDLRARIPALLFVGWLSGLGVLLAQTVLGWVRVRGLYRRSLPMSAEFLAETARPLLQQSGIRRSVAFRCSGTPSSAAMTWGFLRPVVLLPSTATEWSPERMKAVLLHELAHIHRADWCTQTLTQLICAFYWFHPCVWWAAQGQRAISERACDDRVLMLGMTGPDYAAHLLEIVRSLHRQDRPAPGTVGMAQGPQIEARLRAILDARSRRDGPTRRGAALTFALALALLLPLAALRVAARQALPLAALPLSAGENVPNRPLSLPERSGPATATASYADPASAASLNGEVEHVLWGKAAHGLQVGIVAPKSGVAVMQGQHLVVPIRLRNVGSRPLVFPIRIAPNGTAFTWEAMTQNDAQIFLRPASAPASGATTVQVSLAPGEERPLPGPVPQCVLQQMGNSAVVETTAFVSPGKRTVQVLPFAADKSRVWLSSLATGTLALTVLGSGSTVLAPPKAVEPDGAAILKEIAWGPVQQGLQAGIRLAGPKRRFLEREQIRVGCYIRNVSDAEIVLAYDGNFSFGPGLLPTILDARGEAHKIDTYFFTGIESEQVVILKPQETAAIPEQSYLIGSFLFEGGDAKYSRELNHLPRITPVVPGHYRMQQPIPWRIRDAQEIREWVARMSAKDRKFFHYESTLLSPTGKISKQSGYFSGAYDLDEKSPLKTGFLEFVIDQSVAPPIPAGERQTTGWGKAAEGLQTGVALVSPQKSYAYGDLITFQLRVRNVGTQPVSLPLGTSDYRAVSLRGGNILALFAFGNKAETLIVPPGEERDAPGQRFTYELRPPDWSGDPKANPERPLMLLGAGHFTVRAPNGLSVRTDPNSTTLTQLRAQPGQVAFDVVGDAGKPEPPADVATPREIKGKIVWGKPVNGLSLGVGFVEGGAVLHDGQKAKLGLYICNTSSKPLTFSCMQLPQSEDSPYLLNEQGESVKLEMTRYTGAIALRPLTLAPGKSWQVGEFPFTVQQKGRAKDDNSTVLAAGPGKYHLTFLRDARPQDNFFFDLVLETASLSFEIR